MKKLIRPLLPNNLWDIYSWRYISWKVENVKWMSFVKKESEISDLFLCVNQLLAFTHEVHKNLELSLLPTQPVFSRYVKSIW